jgi:hypothetical protein
LEGERRSDICIASVMTTIIGWKFLPSKFADLSQRKTPRQIETHREREREREKKLDAVSSAQEKGEDPVRNRTENRCSSEEEEEGRKEETMRETKLWILCWNATNRSWNFTNRRSIKTFS